MFPNFDADVNDPNSYDFTLTDEYIERILSAGTKLQFFDLLKQLKNQVELTMIGENFYAVASSDGDKKRVMLVAYNRELGARNGKTTLTLEIPAKEVKISLTDNDKTDFEGIKKVKKGRLKLKLQANSIALVEIIK